MKTIFVSGPYRAPSEWGVKQNIRRAEDAAVELWKRGWAVFCPHTNTSFFGGACPDEVWLEGDLEFLRRACDAIFMLKAWKESSGAKDELAVALELGREVYYETDGYPLP